MTGRMPKSPELCRECFNKMGLLKCLEKCFCDCKHEIEYTPV